MKQIISLILSICLFTTAIPISACAEESLQKKYIDVIEILSEIQKEYPDLMISEQFKKFGKSVDDGTSAMVMLDSPQVNAKIKELGYVSDGISLLKFAYNICDVKNRTLTWDSEFEAQLQLLADYENPGWLSDNVVKHINSASKHLIESKLDPTTAQIDEGINNVTELLLAKTFDESPFGKVRSGLEAIQIVYGLYDEKSGDVWDAYTELGDVTYSIKIEQMVREMFRYDVILNTDKPLTKDEIETFRNQLTMFLRLDMRNKAQLYNLNCKANENDNWAESDEAKKLYDEVTRLNQLIIILEGTKITDDRILLDTDYQDSMGKIDNNYIITEETQHFNTDWKTVMLNYLKTESNPSINEGYELIYINDDEIPELVERGISECEGSRVISVVGDTISKLQTIRLGIMYIEKGNLLLNEDGNMGYYYTDIYALQNGEFEKIFSGSCHDPEGVPMKDENGQFVFEYEIDGNSVSEETYLQEKEKIFPCDKAISEYNHPLESYESIIRHIESM